MKVLITGGAGFIGSNLSKYFASADASIGIRVLDDLSTGFQSNLDGSSAEFVRGSILDSGLLEQCVADVDAIVHLAAIPSVPRSIDAPFRSHEANATGTLKVLEAARKAGIAQVLVASSSSVYGSNPILPKSENAWTRPMSPYAASKLATEAYAIAYNHSYGMNNLAFRFFNVYGPGQAAGHAYAAVIPQFIDHALKGVALPVNGTGEQTRDFTHVESVCATLFAAVRRQIGAHSPVNLAFGTKTSLNELVELIGKELGGSVATSRRPARVGDVLASQADPALFKSLFPDIEPTPLSDGIKTTVNWFRESFATVR